MPSGFVVDFSTSETCIKTGEVISASTEYTTVIMKLLTASFPAVSTAVQITVVVPSEKNAPEGGLHDGSPTIPPASVAEGVAYDTSLPFGLVVGIPGRSFETTRLGGVVSATSAKMTVTVSSQFLCFLQHQMPYRLL